jgi:hypothetical protein
MVGGGLQAAVVGDGASGGGGELGREREMVVEVRGAIEKQHRLFIGRKKWRSGRDLSTRSLCGRRQWQLENISPLTQPARFLAGIRGRE